MKIYGQSDIGLKREMNQDSIYYVTNENNESLAIVCDGIGGGKAGDVASQLGVEYFKNSFLTKGVLSNDNLIRSWINNTIVEANDLIFAQSTSSRSKRGMGTTLAGVLITPKSTFVFHLGDSRVYGLYDTFISLTEDHNLAADLVKAGELEASEAMYHPKGSMLTNALGIWGDVKVDINKIKDNYRALLICSDGLHGYVSHEYIERVIRSNEATEKKVKDLIDASNLAGGYDNVSVIICNKEED